MTGPFLVPSSITQRRVVTVGQAHDQFVVVRRLIYCSARGCGSRGSGQA
jgi:hypothetical protein